MNSNINRAIKTKNGSTANAVLPRVLCYKNLAYFFSIATATARDK